MELYWDHERRRAPRVPLRGRVIAHTGSRKLACPGVDVGPGGVAMVGLPEDTLGCSVHVEIDLDDDAGRISAEGVVVGRSQRQGRWVWGVQFRDLHPRLAGVLQRYVDWRLGKSGRPFVYST